MATKTKLYQQSIWAGTTTAASDLYLLRATQFDEGGAVYGSGSDSNDKGYSLLMNGSGLRLTVGGYFDRGALADKLVLSYTGYYWGYLTGSHTNSTAVRYTGDGELDVSPATGAGVFGDKQESGKNGTRTVTVSKNVNITDSSYTTEPGAQNCTVSGIEALSGTLTLISDAALDIGSTAALVVEPHIVGAAKDKTDVVSGQEVMAAGYRVQNIVIDGNITGTLDSTSSANLLASVALTAISSNKVQSYGIVASGTIALNGYWLKETNNETGVSTTAAINATVTNVVMENELETGGGTATTANTITLSDNEFSAVGIQGSALTIADIGRIKYTSTDGASVVEGGVINSTVSGVYLYGSTNAKDKSNITFSGNTVRAVGMKGENLTLTGRFDPNINSKIKNVVYEYGDSLSYTLGVNNVYLYGLEFSGSVTATGNMNGDFTLSFNDGKSRLLGTRGQTKPLYSVIDAAGISAGTISVGGILNTDINLTVNHNFYTDMFSGSSTYDTNLYMGIHATTLTADSLDSDITVDSTYRTGRTIGLFIQNSMTNNDDGIFDVTGNISVTNPDTKASYLSDSASIGMMGFSGGMNLRISGNITATNANEKNAYSFFSGTLSYTGSTSSYTVDDYLEFAAGAEITGQIALQAGRNTLRIDSNARLYGNIDSYDGTINLEYILNENVIRNDSALLKDNSTAIIQATQNKQLESTVHVTVDLNNAVANKSYILYENTTAGVAADWGNANRDITFRYQGISADMVSTAEQTRLYNLGIEFSDKGITGSLNYVTKPKLLITLKSGAVFEIGVSMNDAHTRFLFNVGSLPVSPSVPLKQLKNLTETLERAKNSVTLTWVDPDSAYDVTYELEYRILGDGSNGKTVVRELKLTPDSSGKISYTLDNIEKNQTVEWRVRQSAAGGTIVSDWADLNGTTPVKYVPVCDKVTETNFLKEASGQSAVAVLTWSPGAKYTEGLSHYIVQYFWKSTELTDEELEEYWKDNTKIIEKQTSSSTLCITNLANRNYIYWRVQAVDLSGNSSGWTDGTMLRVYDGDETAPYFANTDFSIKTAYQTNWKSKGWNGPLLPKLTFAQAYDDDSGVVRYILTYTSLTDSTITGTIDIPKSDLVYDKTTGTYTYDFAKTANANGSTIKGLANDNYSWRVQAVDYVGNYSKNVLTQVSYGDKTAPTFDQDRTYLTIANDYNSDTKVNSITLNWPTATDTGEAGLYKFFIDICKIGSTTWSNIYSTSKTANTAATFTIKDGSLYYGDTKKASLSNGEYKWRVTVYDKAFNKTILKSPNVIVVDTTPPTGSFSVIQPSPTVYLIYQTSSTPGSGSGSILVNTGGSGSSSSGTTSSGTTTTTGTTVTVNNSKSQKVATDLSSSGVSVSSVVITGFADVPSVTVQNNAPDTEDTLKSAVVTLNVAGSFSDTTGVYYYYQFSGTSDFSTHVDYASTKTSLEISNSSEFKIGELLGLGSKVYYRVMAGDAIGNKTGIWKVCTTPIYMADGQHLKPTSYDSTTKSYTYTIDQNYALRDLDTPGKVKSLSYTLAPTSITFNWKRADDVFGIKEYTVKLTSSTTGDSYTVKTADLSAVFRNLSESKYTYRVLAADYAGHISKKVSGSFMYDYTAPVFDETMIDAVRMNGSTYLFWNAATDAVSGLAGYILSISPSATSASTVQTSVLDATTTTKIISDVSGSYYFRLQAVDLNGNLTTGSWKQLSPSSTETGHTRETAVTITASEGKDLRIGTDDRLEDYFRIDVTNPEVITFTVDNISALLGKNSTITAEVFYKDNTTAQLTLSIDPSKGRVFKALCQTDGPYYLKLTGAATSYQKFNLSHSTVELDDPDNPGSTKATAKELGKTLTTYTVGNYDSADYFKITVSGQTTTTISLKDLENIYGTGSNLRVEFFNGAKSVKAFKVNTASKTIMYNMSAGTYYLKLSTFSSDKESILSYALKADRVSTTVLGTASGQRVDDLAGFKSGDTYAYFTFSVSVKAKSDKYYTFDTNSFGDYGLTAFQSLSGKNVAIDKNGHAVLSSGTYQIRLANHSATDTKLFFDTESQTFSWLKQSADIQSVTTENKKKFDAYIKSLNLA